MPRPKIQSALAAREEDLLVYTLTAIIVFLAALGVSGGPHLYMLLTHPPPIPHHTATPAFRPAVPAHRPTSPV